MYCCENCFSDSELQAIVRSGSIKGDCDLCESQNVHICQLENNNILQESFENLIDLYSPIEILENDALVSNPLYLKTILKDYWNIFAIDENKVDVFLKTLFCDKYRDQPELFDDYVFLPGMNDEQICKKYSLLGNSQWGDFVTEIKERNRFHTNIINKNVLKNLFQASCKKYKKGEIFYRARIWKSDKKFICDDMWAPPPYKASAGRANPEGISCLYLANSVDTALHEIRARVHDRASVAKFKLKSDIEVVDLAAIDKISPFQEIDINLLAYNYIHLKHISSDISKPLRRHDSPLDYLPTQYISDFIKSEGFSGIEYKSTMFFNGLNLAIFDQSLFECVDVKAYDINSIEYKYNKVEG